MIGWLYRIIIGHFKQCHHTWIKEAEYKIFEDAGDKIPCAMKYVLKCAKCGEVTVRKI